MTSLFDRPPHVVWVTPKVPHEDKYGRTTYKSGERVGPIPCAVQPYTSGQNNVTGVKIKAYGTQVKVGYTVYVKGDWPGGPASIVEWNGNRYQQDGEAQIFGMSPTTSHIEIGIIEETVDMY